MVVELQCVDLTERHRMRTIYAASDEERDAALAQLADASCLWDEWCTLCKTADAVDDGLEDVKARFSAATCEQVWLPEAREFTLAAGIWIIQGQQASSRHVSTCACHPATGSTAHPMTMSAAVATHLSAASGRWQALLYY